MRIKPHPLFYLYQSILLLKNVDIEDLNISTSKKVICLDCMAIKDPHVLLKNKFENKKLILIMVIPFRIVH